MNWRWSFCLVFLLTIAFLPTVAHAERYGFSGLIQITYERDLYENESPAASSKTEQWSIEQRYNLNYRNFIIDPRIFDFTLGGTFVKEDGKTNVGDIGVRNKDYNIRFDFIRGSRYPFSLFATKYSNTSFTPLSEWTSSLIKQTTKSIGLEGLARFRPTLVLRYKIQQDDRRAETETGITTDERARSATFGLHKALRDGTADLSYSFINTDYRITDETENRHTVNLNLQTGLARNVRFTETASFDRNSLTEMTEVRSNSYFEYVPSSRFRGSMSIYYDYIKLQLQKGHFASNFYNATYRFSDALMATADALLMYNTGDFAEEKAESFTTGLSFSKPVASELVLAAGTLIGVSASQTPRYNRNTLDYTLSSSLTKTFLSIRTSLTGGGVLRYHRTSLEGREDRYDAYLTLTTGIVKNLSLQSRVEYINDKVYEDLIDTTEQRFTHRKEVTSDSFLSYFLPIGWRGRFDLRAGLTTSDGTVEGKTTEETTERRFYYGEAAFSYLVLLNLSVLTSFKYMHDTSQSSDTYTGSANIDYRLRRVFVSMKYEYWLEKRPDNQNRRTKVFVQISRPF